MPLSVLAMLVVSHFVILIYLLTTRYPGNKLPDNGSHSRGLIAKSFTRTAIVQ